MVRQAVSVASADERIFKNPWPALATGVALTGMASLWFLIKKEPLPPAVFLGLLAGGVGVAIQPRSPLVLLVAALAGFLGWTGLKWDPEVGGMNWDSIRMVIAVLTAVALLAAILVVLPRAARRLAVSLLVLFHFGGIATAVTLVAPNPWISNILWLHVYRPYLEFFYLMNAYHFYSPDPGPGTQLWFYVNYEDGQSQEYRIPNFEEKIPKLEYQRRLSIVESINQRMSVPPGADKVQRRLRAGQLNGVPVNPDGISESLLYWEPQTWYSKHLLHSYARLIARKFPHPPDSDRAVTSVKIYLVLHNILGPQEILKGSNPEGKWNYRPYFMGEFDADGKLLDANDPYLYWLIPIVHKVAEKGPFRILGPGRLENDENEATDYLEVHRKLRKRQVEVGDADIPGGN